MRDKTANKKTGENLAPMSFKVDEKLKNKFKAKLAGEGRKLKDVMAQLMEEYLKEKR